MRSKFWLVLIIIVSIALLFFVYPNAWHKIHLPGNFPSKSFHLGLDLVGGTHLVYQADLKSIGSQSASDAMQGVRDVIERRVNLFGVSEPIVQIEGRDRLIVELAGINDVNQAIQLIGQTPFLEFKEERPAAETQAILDAQKKGQRKDEDPYFVSTGLTGRQLKSSQLVFDQTTGSAQVSLSLTSEGAKLFGEITKRNLGKRVAIYLDGQPISIPVVQNEIDSGNAVISGTFTPQEAKDLANRLNAGALPVPISLVSQQTIGATLGKASLTKSLTAGMWGFILVALFMMVYYRLPGVMAVLALICYVIYVLTIYKVFGVTFTLAGIAGFILSLGIAVDANVLIFARMREELKAGKMLRASLDDGFRRAWYSIRDSHVTTLLGAVILYIFTTSIVKGFALTLFVGVLLSLVTSIIVTRSFMFAILGAWLEKRRWLL